MAKKTDTTDVLLGWTENVPSADVQDPLGTSLRGSTRLANRLLFCITSITPRARYFSFIPWCVQDYKKREAGTPYAPGLREGIRYREHALTLGCVAHHDGNECSGGALVGSEKAKEWYAKHQNETIDFRRTRFVKNPALDAYFNSLVNLGLFITEEDLPELGDDEEPPEMTFDDVELTELGLTLASRYDSAVGGLKSVKEAAARERKCSVKLLKSLGERGGLCELALPTAPERELLRDIFLCRIELQGDSHSVRRQTLLLLLDLCQRLSDSEWAFNAGTFAESIYYGMLFEEGEPFEVSVPDCLQDIATRWRMFYFHYYMSVALEGLFSWLVMRLYDSGIAGEPIDSLVKSVNEELVRKEIGEVFGIELSSSFGEITPAEFFESLGIPKGPLDADIGQVFDQNVRSDSSAAESFLEVVIRKRQFTYSSTGAAMSIGLLVMTLGRFQQWEETKYGNWFASIASDPYLDLIPPVVLHGLSRRFDDWWNTPFAELTSFVLTRFIIQQHQAMSYVKSASGHRCVLQVDGPVVCATGTYDRIGIGNARFHSAVQVLVDLGLLVQGDDKQYVITDEGRSILEAELRKEQPQ